jgi:hypothetical protein
VRKDGSAALILAPGPYPDTLRTTLHIRTDTA